MLTPVFLAACSPQAMAPHGQTLITIADAQAQLRHYEAVVSDAYTKRDPALINSVEGGSTARLDDVYLSAQVQSPAPPPPPIRVDQVRVYAPYQSSYPAQFLAYAVTESPLQQPSADLLLFTKANATAPWKVVLSSSYEDNTTPPAITLDDAGYASVLSAAQAAQLPVPQATLSQAYATMLTTHTPTGSVTPLSPFTPGPFTSGLVINDHDSVTPSDGAFQHVSISYSAQPTDALGAYRLDGGSTLVFFNAGDHETYTSATAAGSLEQDPKRTSYPAAVPPGRYKTISVERLAMYAAIVSPPGAAASVAVVARNSNAVSAVAS